MKTLIQITLNQVICNLQKERISPALQIGRVASVLGTVSDMEAFEEVYSSNFNVESTNAGLATSTFSVGVLTFFSFFCFGCRSTGIVRADALLFDARKF